VGGVVYTAKYTVVKRHMINAKDTRIRLEDKIATNIYVEEANPGNVPVVRTTYVKVASQSKVFYARTRIVRVHRPELARNGQTR
jgi:hypothetical protein